MPHPRKPVYELRELHRPEGGFAHFDLILVHGFGGSSDTTWTKDKNPAWFWPEWLWTKRLLETARVWVFDYNAARNLLPFRTSIAGPHEFAIQLLEALEKRDSKVCYRIFLVDACC
jgi:hypothetical protein